MRTRWSNESELWGWMLVRVLEECGLKQAVVSPGSRSTPLAWALAHSRIEALPILDERSAAFYALGLARRGGRPVALLCTSGTAAANYLPALVEARESGAPLLVLTADRPPQLRRCAAGQTVDQVKMYGSAALDYFELPVPEAKETVLRHARQIVTHALRRTMLPCRGPVHVNVPLREPLAPQTGKVLDLAFDPAALVEGLTPVGGRLPLPRPETLALPGNPAKILIVAGSLMPDDDAAARTALFSLAERTKAPVLCDGLGPWRCGDSPDATRIAGYDLILSSPRMREALKPDYVVQVGPLPTSKALRSWLCGLDAKTLVATTGIDDTDAARAKAQLVQIAPEDLASLPLPAASDGAVYRAAWLEAEAKTAAIVSAALQEAHPGFEGRIARILFKNAEAGADVSIANSMSVRDVETYREPGGANVRTFFSRGANGIDGTLATALGASHGARGILLAGDLALLHDCGSLLSAQRHRGSLTVVLVDNRGGGIFETLPVAKLDDPAFEAYFATPQEANFTALAHAFGAEYEKLESPAALAEKIRTLPESGLRILHLETDRKKDSAFRAELRRRAEQAF